MVSTSSPAVRGGVVRRPSLTAAGGLANRAVKYGLAAAAAGVLAACGSTGGTTGTGGGAAPGSGQQPAASQGTMLSSRNLSGLGPVLVDQSGKTVYSPQQEFNGTIKCTGGCLSFWVPVKAGATLSASGTLTGKLGTTHRKD